MPPVTMPPDAVRAAGLDPDVWHGLGIVGIWAAVDAFAERRGHHRSELPRLLSPRLKRAWLEIDDLRHLYAHNFGGKADARYFGRTRNCLAAGTPYTFASGSNFDGRQLVLTVQDLDFYIDEGRAIVRHLDSTCP